MNYIKMQRNIVKNLIKQIEDFKKDEHLHPYIQPYCNSLTLETAKLTVMIAEKVSECNQASNF